MFEQLFESACERLFASPGGYEMGSAQGGGDSDPERGAIVPLASGIASLPPRGSVPVPPHAVVGQGAGQDRELPAFHAGARRPSRPRQDLTDKSVRGHLLEAARVATTIRGRIQGSGPSRLVRSPDRIGQCVLRTQAPGGQAPAAPPGEPHRRADRGFEMHALLLADRFQLLALYGRLRHDLLDPGGRRGGDERGRRRCEEEAAGGRFWMRTRKA